MIILIGNIGSTGAIDNIGNIGPIGDGGSPLPNVGAPNSQTVTLSVYNGTFNLNHIKGQLISIT